MLRWQFRVYVAPGGRSDVQRDIDRHDDYGRMHLRRQVAHLRITAKLDWKKPHALKLKGFQELYEIRYQDHRQQTRAIGFFGPREAEFTITLICTHKGNVYKPHDALQTAADRAKAILAGQAETVALLIDGEDVSEDVG